MKSYIVKQNDELKIMQVKPKVEAAFLEQYKGCIMAEGNNIQEVIIKFSKLMNEQSE
jgi:hypothetical protein